MRTCPTCGTPLAARVRICRTCAAVNPSASAAPVVTAARRRRRPRPVGAAALAPMPAATATLPRTPPPKPPTLVATETEIPPLPLRCRHCLRSPALDVAPRVTVGIVIAHASEEARGPFCAVCGVSRARALSNRTLWLGWWSPLSPFASVRTLWRNWRIIRRLRRLSRPPHGPLPRYAEQPHPEGRPVVLRSGMLVFAVVAAAVLFGVALVALTDYLGPFQLEDECVAVAENGRSLRVLDSCGSADGRIIEIVTGDRACEQLPDWEIALPDYVNNSRACVRALDR